MATDYTTGCGDLALRFIQMLGSTIYGYQDIAGVTHYRINSLIYSDACTELSELVDCNTNHFTPDRLLVENTFALDDCNLLAWKIFSNGDQDWEDYSVCAEDQVTFLEMLSRCIVVYSGHTKINVTIDTDACTELTQLLSCPNDIEAERLLVENVFGIDDCGNILLKLFVNSSTMTDYSTPCATQPESFLEMLARCIVLYDGHYYINIANVTGYCDDLIAFWTCANNHIPAERALVENVFATDACDIMALKIFNNAGEEGREQ